MKVLKKKTQSRWHTTEQVFKKASTTMEFKTAYKVEAARIDIACSLREARTEKTSPKPTWQKRQRCPSPPSLASKVETTASLSKPSAV
jgi:hypothetical protein